MSQMDADLVDITDWEDESDPEIVLRLKTAHMKIITTSIKAHGGVPSKAKILLRKNSRELHSFRCEAPLWTFSLDQENYGQDFRKVGIVQQ